MKEILMDLSSCSLENFKALYTEDLTRVVISYEMELGSKYAFFLSKFEFQSAGVTLKTKI